MGTNMISFRSIYIYIYILPIHCLVVNTNVPITNNETRVVSALTSKTSLGYKVHREKTN